MRRWLFLLWLGLLLVPAAGLLGPPERSSSREGRALAQHPLLPSSTEAWLALPKQTDDFVRDQFGYRDAMMRANATIRESLNDEAGPDSLVVTGRDGFLLLRQGLTQSMGIDVSPERARRDGSLICEMHRRLEREHIRFLYTIAPSPTTIYPEAAPETMGTPASPTNYDLLMAAARACGADAFDLRPVLRARRNVGLLYHRTDTHWTARGALIAFNAVAAHLQHPEFQIDGNRRAWREGRHLGDLTRLMGAADGQRERVESPDLRSLDTAASAETTLPTPANLANMSTIIRDYPREGLSVLVIGDSFAHRYFPKYLAPVARRVTFMHHQACGFDWRNVQQAAPDIVIFIPTERYALCSGGSRPANFDSE